MKNKTIIIGISSDIKSIYNEERDTLSLKWYDFLSKFFSNFILVPIINNHKNSKKIINKLKFDLFLLTGGNNINSYKNRDLVEKFIIRVAIKKNIPIVGICRGMQLLNLYFKGKNLKQKKPDHVNKKHEIYYKNKKILVNSFHNYVIKSINMSKKLILIASAKDKTVEAFKHKKNFIYGIMWHPERSKNINIIENIIFREIKSKIT